MINLRFTCGIHPIQANSFICNDVLRIYYSSSVLTQLQVMKSVLYSLVFYSDLKSALRLGMKHSLCHLRMQFSIQKYVKFTIPLISKLRLRCLSYMCNFRETYECFYDELRKLEDLRPLSSILNIFIECFNYLLYNFDVRKLTVQPLFKFLHLILNHIFHNYQVY